MGTFDTVTWQALTAVLTLAGLVGTVLFWRMRGPVAGLRTLALALLPAAAYLTGTLRLLWEVGDAVTSWALHLTFSPAVWLGLALAGVSLLLYFLAGLLRRHDRGDSGRSLPKKVSGERPAVEGRPAAGRKAASAADTEDDMSDIEAILRKHGIT